MKFFLQISLPSEKRRNATALYNPMTISELQRKFPSIPWVEYINTLLAPDTVVTNEEIVVVSVPSYITKFESIIAKTPKRYLYSSTLAHLSFTLLIIH